MECTCGNLHGIRLSIVHTSVKKVRYKVWPWNMQVYICVLLNCAWVWVWCMDVYRRVSVRVVTVSCMMYIACHCPFQETGRVPLCKHVRAFTFASPLHTWQELLVPVHLAFCALSWCGEGKRRVSECRWVYTAGLQCLQTSMSAAANQLLLHQWGKHVRNKTYTDHAAVYCEWRGQPSLMEQWTNTHTHACTHTITELTLLGEHPHEHHYGHNRP